MTDRYDLPDLPYDYGDLEPAISGQILELHHSKHHAAYVKGANTALERLADARKTDGFAAIAQLERDLAFNLSGHVLHSVYWTNLTPAGSGEPDGELADRIGSDFGGIDAFRKHMTEAAATIQGSGWALASWDPLGERIVVQQVHDHQGQHAQGTVPLLALDAWEHAYYLQYLNEKADYFDAFWTIVNWADVAERLVDAWSVTRLAGSMSAR